MLRVERVEPGVDHDRAVAADDRPHEVVHRHRHIVRIATEEVLGPTRVALRVLDREHFVRCRFGHRRRVPNMDDSLFQTGIDARSRVLGPEFVTKAFSTADSFNRDMQEMVTEYCWGGVWGRSALTDRQRSLNNLCILASLNRSHEFKLHFRGALRNGCTLDELRDTLIQVMVYAGVPAGVEAFRLAREVLDAEGVVPPPTDEPMPDIADSPRGIGSLGSMTVGFIGLGKMGGPMAANVAAATPGLVCFDVAGTEDRMPAGAVAATSIADLARRCATVLISVPDGAATLAVAEQIVATDDSVVATVVDLSTIGPKAAIEAAASARPGRRHVLRRPGVGWGRRGPSGDHLVDVRRPDRRARRSTSVAGFLHRTTSSTSAIAPDRVRR